MRRLDDIASLACTVSDASIQSKFHLTYLSLICRYINEVKYIWSWNVQCKDVALLQYLNKNENSLNMHYISVYINVMVKSSRGSHDVVNFYVYRTNECALSIYLWFMLFTWSKCEVDYYVHVNVICPNNLESITSITSLWNEFKCILYTLY